METVCRQTWHFKPEYKPCTRIPDSYLLGICHKFSTNRWARAQWAFNYFMIVIILYSSINPSCEMFSRKSEFERILSVGNWTHWRITNDSLRYSKGFRIDYCSLEIRSETLVWTSNYTNFDFNAVSDKALLMRSVKIVYLQRQYYLICWIKRKYKYKFFDNLCERVACLFSWSRYL